MTQVTNPFLVNSDYKVSSIMPSHTEDLPYSYNLSGLLCLHVVFVTLGAMVGCTVDLATLLAFGPIILVITVRCSLMF